MSGYAARKSSLEGIGHKLDELKSELARQTCGEDTEPLLNAVKGKVHVELAQIRAQDAMEELSRAQKEFAEAQNTALRSLTNSAGPGVLSLTNGEGPSMLSLTNGERQSATTDHTRSLHDGTRPKTAKKKMEVRDIALAGNGGSSMPLLPVRYSEELLLKGPASMGNRALQTGARGSRARSDALFPVRYSEELLLKGPGSMGSLAQLNSPTSTPSTERLPWGRFFVVWVACTLAAGVLPGQAMFIPLFAQAGVYGSVCEATPSDNGHQHVHANGTDDYTDDKDHHGHLQSGQLFHTCKEQYLTITSIFQAGSGVAYMLILPIGMFFDRWGARTVGTAGAATVALGLLMMTSSVFAAQAGLDATFSTVFSVGITITDFGSQLNSMSLLGLIWHFPGRQSFVLTLINSTYGSSALLPLCLKFVMDLKIGMSLGFLMLAYVVTVILAILICWFTVPSQEEYYKEAKRVLGMPLPRPPKSIQICSMIYKAVDVLRLYTCDHMVCGLVLGLGMAFPTLYSSLAAPYGEALFGSKDDGDRLAATYTSLTGVIGLVVGPLAGHFVDRFGFRSFLVFVSLLIVVASLTCGVKSWLFQNLSCGTMSLFMTLFFLFISRYLLQYSPPNRFGTVQGLFIFLIVVVYNLPAIAALLVWSSMLPKGVDAYRTPLQSSGALSAVLMLLYACYYCKHPAPDVPPLLPEDEVELARNFGCGSLEEVMEVTHISTRKELIRQLASPDPDVMAGLVMSIDTEKMAEMMGKRSVEDLAIMMEDAGEEEEEQDDEDDDEDRNETGRGRAKSDADHEGGHEVTEASSDPPNPGKGRNTIMVEELGNLNLDPEPSSQEQPGTADDSEAEELAKKIRYWLDNSDKQALTDYILNTPIEMMDAVDIVSNDLWTEAENKKMNKDFGKLINGKEFAALLRKRPELKAYVQRSIKREMDRRIGNMFRKKSSRSSTSSSSRPSSRPRAATAP